VATRKTVRTGRRRTAGPPPSVRKTNYHNLRNPFPAMQVFSDDQAAAMHETALRILEELGMKVLLPEAIEVFRKGGATVKGDMVHIGRDMVDAALASAPKSITGRAGIREKDLTFELGRMMFAAAPYCYTIINTNSPRTLDIPMAQGLIDFAKHGQLSIVTPFTLMGAMAPITVAGAVTLSHAEALAAITLTQLVNPGAPVCYGTFTSNVDMKSGAPAFGTPAHYQASLAAGQMARLTGLPWRSAAGSASNLNDVQAANENQMGLWGCLMAGATVIIHSAGWLEGGLSVSYEKIITDVEVLNMVAELCAGAQAGADEIGFDNALSHVDPSGHFFAAPQTMERYNTEFYEPIVHDYANFGTWTERGARDASARATDVWQTIIRNEPQVEVDTSKLEGLRSFIAKRTAQGGALPES